MFFNKYIKGALLYLLVGALTAPFCSCGVGQGSYQSVYYDLFDSVTILSGYSQSAEKFNESAKELHSMLLDCHKVFDAYNEYEGINNTATVNKNAGVKPVKVEKELLSLALLSEKYYNETSGAFDVTLGALTALWKNASALESPLPPSKEEIERELSLCGFEHLEIDEQASTLFIKTKGVSLDFGAIAKGYAGDLALDMLKKSNISSGVLTLGGNVCVFGQSNESDGLWRVDIQHPRKKVNILSLRVPQTNVVTSGDYQRYFVFDGIRYHHIIDPQSGYPASNYASVTVIAQSSALCDALSTAFFVLDKDKASEIARTFEAEVIWINADGCVEMTEGAEKLKS